MLSLLEPSVFIILTAHLNSYFKDSIATRGYHTDSTNMLLSADSEMP